MIEVKHLSQSYGDQVIYEELNLRFEQGKSYALMGPSGSGKTTLLNTLAKMAKRYQGQVWVQGKDLKKIREKTYFRTILGYVFQSYALIDDWTVAQNLAIVDKDKLKQLQVLEAVGLSSAHLKKRVHQLSGGEGQRLAIARVRLKAAKIILADEPTGSLDEANAHIVQDLLLGSQREDGVLIVATHDEAFAARCDHIIAIPSGEWLK